MRKPLLPRSGGGSFLILLLIILSLKELSGQVDSLEGSPEQDTLASSSAPQDTGQGDEGLDARVDYQAKDSIRFDREEGKIYLFGDAKVEYKKITLEAARIRFSFQDRTVEAEGVKDSTGELKGTPVMNEGGKEFDAERIRYNFKTKKGLIHQVHTQEGEGDLYSEKTKKHPNGEIHVHKGKYTTCTLDDYYIRFNKAVVIPKDKIVSGPANLVIGNIPTPLLLPFGYYPHTEGGSSGVVLPQYGENRELGFYLMDGGYYWRFEPHVDTRITADIYSKGSWGVENLTRYRKRYKYEGNLNVSYSDIQRGEPELPEFTETQEFFVRWRHRQDPKARPNSNFSANVNIGTEDNFRNNLNSTGRDYLNNSFQSNIDYSKNWANSPVSFNGSLRHNQNSQSGDMDLTLPDLGLNVSRFYPFEGLGSSGSASRKWYEKIGVNYSGNFRNRIKTQNRLVRADRLEQILDHEKEEYGMDYGMRHEMNATTSLKPGFFTITPTVGVSDRWYMETRELEWNEEAQKTDTNTVSGFQNGLEPRASMDFTSKLYGMYQFRGERQTTIRHVLTPNIGFTYRPSAYDQPRRDYNNDGRLETYNPYQGTVFGGPTPRSSGDINFSLINNLEGKYNAVNDSTTETKKFKLLENVSIRSNYDIFADSLNWSSVNISGRTTLLETFNVRFQTSFDPYAVNANGRRIDRSHWEETGEWLRWQRSSLTVGGNLNQRDQGSRVPSGASGSTMQYIRNNPNAYVDFKIPWNLGFNYNLRANAVYREGEPPVNIDQTIDLNGNFRLTEKWKVDFRSGYDPEAKEITYTEINIFRDLDCWEMSFNWVPFGRRRSYSFQINLAAPFLKDMKLQKRQQWSDQGLELE